MRTLYKYLVFAFLGVAVSCTQKTDAVSNWKTTVEKMQQNTPQINNNSCAINNSQRSGIGIEAYSINNGKLYWIYMPVKYPKLTVDFCCEENDSCKKIFQEELAGTPSNFEEMREVEPSKPSYTIYYGSSSIAP